MIGFRDIGAVAEGTRPTRKPEEERPCNGGIQLLYRFANGRGASVVRHSFSYGREIGNWELAVIGATGLLDYSTPITDDVLGDLTSAQVDEVLSQIEALPPVAR